MSDFYDSDDDLHVQQKKPLIGKAKSMFTRVIHVVPTTAEYYVGQIRRMKMYLIALFFTLTVQYQIRSYFRNQLAAQLLATLLLGLALVAGLYLVERLILAGSDAYSKHYMSDTIPDEETGRATEMKQVKKKKNNKYVELHEALKTPPMPHVQQQQQKSLKQEPVQASPMASMNFQPPPRAAFVGHMRMSSTPTPPPTSAVTAPKMRSSLVSMNPNMRF